MYEILLKAASLISIIALGYVLKRVGFFKREDYHVLAKIVINITLPAAVINAFTHFDKDYRMLLLVIFGFFCTVIPILTAYFLSAKDKKEDRVFKMLNSSGFNIGCFGLPFMQAFFGPTAVIPTCMFDMGNAVIVTGGSYAITSSLLHTDINEKLTVSGFLKKLFAAPPLDAYIIMFILSFLDIKLPRFVFETASVMSNANVFLSMLMIGLMLEIKLKKEHIGKVTFVLVARLLFATVFAVFIYRFGPFSLMVRKVIVLCLFTPIGTLSAIFTEKCGGDGGLASFTGSLSILLSIVVMIAVAIIIKI